MRKAIMWVNEMGNRLKVAQQHRVQNRLRKRLGKLVSYGLS